MYSYNHQAHAKLSILFSPLLSVEQLKLLLDNYYEVSNQLSSTVHEVLHLELPLLQALRRWPASMPITLYKERRSHWIQQCTGDDGQRRLLGRRGINFTKLFQGFSTSSQETEAQNRVNTYMWHRLRANTVPSWKVAGGRPVKHMQLSSQIETTKWVGIPIL